MISGLSNLSIVIRAGSLSTFDFFGTMFSVGSCLTGLHMLCDPLAHRDFGRTIVLLDRLFRILPDVASELITSDHLILSTLSNLEIRIGSLAADNADVLKVFNGCLVRIININ